MDTVAITEDHRRLLRGDTPTHAGRDPCFQFRCSSGGHPGTDPLDSTEGSVAEEPTEDQGSEAKTFKRFASKTQHVQTQGPEVLPEESANTRKQAAICGVFIHQHREDTATQQTAQQKGTGIGGPIGEAEHPRGSSDEGSSKYREMPQGERTSSRRSKVIGQQRI